MLYPLLVYMMHLKRSIYMYMRLLDILNVACLNKTINYLKEKIYELEEINMYDLKICYRNQCVIWSAWPPCLHVWHHVNQLLNSVNLLSHSSLLLTLDVVICNPLTVPICIKHIAHRGNGFLQFGHEDIYKKVRRHYFINIKYYFTWNFNYCSIKYSNRDILPSVY